jgi:16S rRNA (cytosine967-C5)-methyltransferase
MVTDLTQGVVRHRLYLWHRISPHLKKPGASMPAGARYALLLGAYQLLMTPDPPRHAVVAETVNVLKGTSFAGLTGLVNAVLRKLDPAAPSPPLPEEPAAMITTRYSLPPWLVDALIEQLGADETAELAAAINEPPRLTLRVNTLKTSREALMDELAQAGLQARPGRLSPWAVVVESPAAPGALEPLDRGRCTVQDEGAQLLAPLLEPSPGSRVLDACAAPGGKTGHLYELMAGQGLLAAADISLERLRTMSDNLRRMDQERIAVLAADLLQPPFTEAAFEYVLLDVPCSGTGVLRRHPEGKWGKDPDSINRLAAIQADILEQASSYTCKGGLILYCTCSLLTRENEVVVERFLEQGSYRLIDIREKWSHLPENVFTGRGELRLWPHLHGTDGFYGALLERV